VKEGDDLIMFTRTAGTLAFAAPERLTENCIYNEKVDMWASGIVLFMLLVGSHPFESNGSIAQLFEQIMKGEEVVRQALEKFENLSLTAK
jgi:serine/threonine protein kinase